MTDVDPSLLTASELVTAYARHGVSPVAVLEAVTERIARLNPRINAFAVMCPQSLRAAGESEMRWRAGRPMGPLDGVPTTVKDLVDLSGFPTRRGSRLTSPDPVADDAPVVLGLKAAGAVVIGKTTTTEFGWKSPGDCPLHGITRNPWNMARTTGGSSSGAGAAAAAGFGALHVGTDAGGSVRIPAAWCGAVGLKPTFGRVPQWPLGAFAGVAVAGPIARTVRDAAMMLTAMARFDPRDPFCLPDDPRDWTAGLEVGVAGLRVAVLRNPGFEAPVEPAGAEAVAHACDILAAAGADVIEADPELPDTRAVFTSVWRLALSRLVEQTPEDRRILFDSGFIDAASGGADMRAADVLAVEALRIQTAHAIARFHQRFDLLLSPTVPIAAPDAGARPPDPVEALWTQWAPWTFTYNLTRQPAISVPIGLDGAAMPLSVQIAAPMYRDDLVLRAARVIEMAVPPVMPSVA